MAAVFQFIQQVRQEMQKVTWSGVRETHTSTAVVAVIVFISACFFMLTDSVAFHLVQWLLTVGN
jgi:preprotein translocase SecE subunit